MAHSLTALDLVCGDGDLEAISLSIWCPEITSYDWPGLWSRYHCIQPQSVSGTHPDIMEIPKPLVYDRGEISDFQ